MARAIEAQLKTRRWRRVEYERLVDLGMFTGERLELLAGLLIVGEPQGSHHAAIVAHVGQVLALAFGSGWHPRLQMPLALDDDSEPEPDVAVVAGVPRDYLDAHPATAALVVEVAESSLRLDRVKSGLYARAGIQDYWIANLVDRPLEVHREPHSAAESTHGRVYRFVELLHPPATVAPLASPTALIRVADLLP